MDGFVLMGATLGGAAYRRRRRRRLWLTFAPEAWLLRTQQRVRALQAALQALRPALLASAQERRDAACAVAVRRIDALLTAQQEERRHLPLAGHQYSESIDQLMVAYLWRVYALRDGDLALLAVTDRQIAALGREALAAQIALNRHPQKRLDTASSGRTRQRGHAVFLRHCSPSGSWRPLSGRVR